MATLLDRAATLSLRTIALKKEWFGKVEMKA
jgi:hypothetical protein